jgi:hypothetical protein
MRTSLPKIHLTAMIAVVKLGNQTFEGPSSAGPANQEAISAQAKLMIRRSLAPLRLTEFT